VTRKPRKVDLTEVGLKLDRAKHHVETFSDELKAFLERDPKPFAVRADKKPGVGDAIEYVLYAIVRAEPPKELALPFGDAVQNMRAALDYLAYELSSKRARNSGETAFPIFSDECRFKVLGVPRIASIRGDERTFIERVQPYAASKVPQEDPFAILRRLSNLDKHNLLVPTIAAVNRRESWIASDNAKISWHYFAKGAVKDGTKILAFTATPALKPSDMRVYPESALHVQIKDRWITHFEIDALELLQMIEHHIRWTIELWFERSYMPRTWQEVEASTSTAE
jgi:hypothetical protein